MKRRKFLYENVVHTAKAANRRFAADKCRNCADFTHFVVSLRTGWNVATESEQMGSW